VGSPRRLDRSTGEKRRSRTPSSAARRDRDRDPRRHETFKAEVRRMASLFKDKLRSDRFIRLAPSYLALRIISAAPYGMHNRYA
jgi:hypothetical protein